MTYAQMKATAKQAIREFVDGKNIVVVADVQRHVEQVSGLDYANSTIGKLLKGVGFERVPETNGAMYHRAA